MRNKTRLYQIALIITFYATSVSSTPLEEVFVKRDYLQELAVVCTVTIHKRIDYTPKGNLLIRKMNRENFKEWEKKEYDIYKAFLRLCLQQIKAHPFCPGKVPNYHDLRDTVLINILIETLGDLPVEMDRDVNYCLNKIPYPYLEKRRTQIIDKLREVKDIGRFSYLVAVIQPPATMKNKILAMQELSIGLKARLGDDDAECSLIQEVNEYTKGRINNIVHELFLCGTNQCLKAALELFVSYNPVLDTVSGCVIKPERAMIIHEFRKYHPDLLLLHEKYVEVRKYFAAHASAEHSRKRIRSYIEEFVNWGNKEYGTDLIMEDYFLFHWQCDPKFKDEQGN